jgi:hypothetical protein
VAVGLVTLLDGVVGACFVVAFFVTAGAEPGMLASAGAERTLVMLGEWSLRCRGCTGQSEQRADRQTKSLLWRE